MSLLSYKALLEGHGRSRLFRVFVADVHQLHQRHPARPRGGAGPGIGVPGAGRGFWSEGERKRIVRLVGGMSKEIGSRRVLEV